jgi:hypothetical protein
MIRAPGGAIICLKRRHPVASVQHSLFSWQEVEASSDIQRLAAVLDTLEDDPLIAVLTQERKQRRDDYPIVAVWNSIIAAFLFNLPGPAALIRELRRNAELRQVCGFDPVLGDKAVPPAWVYSRFFRKLDAHQSLVTAIFHRLLEHLRAYLPELGRHVAVDSKALPARHAKEKDADIGTKTEKLPDGEERVTFSWFGYKLHLLIDSTHEIPLAFEVTAASASDSPRLLPLVGQLERQHPEVLAQTYDLSADLAYDDGADKQLLYEAYEIHPVIPSRALGKEKMKPLDPRHHDTIYVSRDGQVCCKVRPFDPDPNAAYCPMEYQGFEKDRGTLKFRCPAAAFGVECRNQAACRSQTKDQGFGRVLRIGFHHDPRLYTSRYQHSRAFKTLYKARTSIERFFYRLDHFYGFEHPQWGGLKRVTTRVTLALTAVLATALAWCEAKQHQKIRSKFQAA